MEQGEEEVLSLDLGWRREEERLGKRKAMAFITLPLRQIAGESMATGLRERERERVLVYAVDRGGEILSGFKCGHGYALPLLFPRFKDSPF